MIAAMKRLALFLLAASAAAQTFSDVTMTGRETREDDLPSIAAAPDGSMWQAWMNYADRRDEISLRQHKDGKWGNQFYVPNTSGDVWLPQVGVDSQNRVWVVWSQGLDGNWDIYARRFNPAEQAWDKLIRITDDPLTDINPRLAGDGNGGFAVVWQGFRHKHSNIFLSSLAGDGWSAPFAVTARPANEWEPAAAFDSGGTLWITYDSYKNGNYDVFLTGVKTNRITEPERAIAATPLYEVKPTIAIDNEDRIWVAYEEGRAGWGKDTGYNLRIRDAEAGAVIGNQRNVAMRVVANGRLQEPTQPLQEAFSKVDGRPGWTYSPHAFVDGAGGLWVAAKLRLNFTGQGNGNRGYWEYYLTRYNGSGWEAPVAFPKSWGRSSTRVNAAIGSGNELWFSWPTDNRTKDYAHRPIKGEVYVGKVAAANAADPQLQAVAEREIEVKQGHPNEGADLDALRGYRTAVHGRPVQIVRGDFHRHTELSWDGGGGNDGSLLDFYRYMIDASAMDFGASTDHQGGAYDYWWWYSQKATDMHHIPGAYTAVYGFERSATQPNGHRNIFYADRSGEVVPFFLRSDAARYALGDSVVGDIPPVGAGELVRDDTKHLYDAVRRMGGVAISHTSGTRMGTDWRDNDPEIEPVVEIFQGARTNYEYVGAPLSAKSGDPKDAPGGYEPIGMVRNAWEKGYRLGITVSSDHGSTHYSYSMVYTDRTTREGILDAIRRRHTYGATDNILLDVRMGEHFMGDEFYTSEPLPIRVKVRGTVDVARVVIFRGTEVIYTHTPNAPEATFEYTDNDSSAHEGTQYYYVRVEQSDGNVAWGSPMWVNYAGPR